MSESERLTRCELEKLDLGVLCAKIERFSIQGGKLGDGYRCRRLGQIIERECTWCWERRWGLKGVRDGTD
jgi:hypothetical protein